MFLLVYFSTIPQRKTVKRSGSGAILMRKQLPTKPELIKKGVLLAGFPIAGTVLLSVLYRKTACKVFLPFAITFGTTSYHVVMRLLVGLVFCVVMQNKADYKKRWYQVGEHETAFYENLGIKNWKRRMPTYDHTLFDPRVHTWVEIAQAMCQAELIHETIVLLSFLPIAEGIWFGAYPVFIVTSVLAAGCDMLFVMMQRYNRHRVMELLKRRSTA